MTSGTTPRVPAPAIGEDRPPEAAMTPPGGDGPAPGTSSTPPPAPASLAPYDAVLLVSFGGPESQEEVMPFLRRVTGGKNIPDERLAVVAEHYVARGGRSPINDECRALLARLRERLDAAGLADVPLAWGNRNGAPELDDVLAGLRERGARRILGVLTSAYSSYSSCRQYRENLAAALDRLPEAPVGDDTLAALGADATDIERRAGMRVDLLPPYATDEAFVGPCARLAIKAVDRASRVADETSAPVHVVFVTHSIPDAMNEASGPLDAPGTYVAQHLQVAEAVAARVAEHRGAPVPWTLAYCSRSGPPSQPWLEPDVNDEIERLAAAEPRPGAVVVAPIGFVADHMEVVHDLDTEAADTARAVGLPFERVPTVRDDAEFAAGLVRLALERAARERRVDPPAAGCPGRCCTIRPGAPEKPVISARPDTAGVGA